MNTDSMERPGRVFIIDDDESVLSGMKQLLEDEGYDVAVSASVIAASFALRRFNPDVVLLDLEMPALGGERLLSLDRARTFPPASQIVLYSGRGREELARLASATGIDGFYSKGDDLTLFLMRLRRWVRCGHARNTFLMSGGNTCQISASISNL